MDKVHLKDIDLIQGCINEDRNSQKALYHRFAGKMMALCLRYARNYSEAEDIMQDAFIKVFNNIHKFQFKGSFEGWIRRIMINTALKFYTKSSYRNEMPGLENYDCGVSQPKVFAYMSLDEILELISELPDGYRMVFNLYAIEGYNHNEIAEMLNISPGTSRSQLVKARRMLQKQILLQRKIRV